MAYFSNGTEGMAFDEQCAKCKYGQEPCPIAYVQMTYNYDQVGNPTAEAILADLVEEDGTCKMYKTFKKDLHTDAHQQKLDL